MHILWVCVIIMHLDDVTWHVYTGGHWDHYVAEFYEFQGAAALPEGLFTLPPVCQACVPTYASNTYPTVMSWRRLNAVRLLNIVPVDTVAGRICWVPRYR